MWNRSLFFVSECVCVIFFHQANYSTELSVYFQLAFETHRVQIVAKPIVMTKEIILHGIKSSIVSEWDFWLCQKHFHTHTHWVCSPAPFIGSFVTISYIFSFKRTMELLSFTDIAFQCSSFQRSTEWERETQGHSWELIFVTDILECRFMTCLLMITNE